MKSEDIAITLCITFIAYAISVAIIVYNLTGGACV